jgi:hypothetical protein
MTALPHDWMTYQYFAELRGFQARFYVISPQFSAARTTRFGSTLLVPRHAARR